MSDMLYVPAAAYDDVGDRPTVSVTTNVTTEPPAADVRAARPAS